MIKEFFRQHYIAFGLAILVGLIYIAPNIFFIMSLGNEYRGIPLMQTAEESYLARIREIIDGHPMLGSFALSEYKEEWPLAPPVGEMFYAIPSVALNVSPVAILVASKFYLPAILFFLIYLLVYSVSDDNESKSFSRKINAVAGALLVILGYDLVDYHGVISFLSGKQDWMGNFLIWARPVHPILGGIFLMSFFLFLWHLIKKPEDRKRYIVGASLCLALMVGSYFFSWGIAVSAFAMLVLLYLLKKKYQTVKNLLFILPVTFILTLPYWYVMLRARQSPWYEESVIRSGFFYTHYPLVNKLMLVVLLVYIALVGLQWWKHKKFHVSTYASDEKFRIGDWHVFCLAFILGPLWAYSQQIVTGMTAWPYHFVQYSIPLAMIVLVVAFYAIVKKESAYLWGAGIIAIITASVFAGVYTQTRVFVDGTYEYYRGLQAYRPLFDELNKKEKDCAVFVREDNRESKMLNVMIPAFTHCNRYVSTEIMSIAPSERETDGYLAMLRLKGVEPDGIENYLKENAGEARAHLFFSWADVYQYPFNDFPDLPETLLKQRSEEFPQKYREFAAKDFRTELNTYRLDYIVSIGPLPDKIIYELGDLELTFDANNLFLYEFIPD